MSDTITVMVSGGIGEVIGTVLADTDFDARFILTEEGTGQRFVVHGWNCDVEILEGEQANV